jgi:cell division septum initiation protein DivIVA
MAEKGFRNWIGYKEENAVAPSENAVDRIRQLETQLADLRSRKDITSLSKEEFEILATETAMSLIKTAQQREARALSAAERMVSETNAAVKSKLESAESKAKSILSGAESRGRKYLEAAETEATELKEKVTRQAEALITESKREANALASAARREAERLIGEAKSEITNFRTWLTTAISESERLYRVQTQSLNAAEQAISETRAKLSHAFERLAHLQTAIDSSLTEENTPVKKSLTGGASANSEKPARKSAAKKRSR